MAYASELLKLIREKLSPSEYRTFTSLFQDYWSQRIQATKLVTSLEHLFKKDKYLYNCFTQVSYCDQEEQEDCDDRETHEDESTNLEQGHNHHREITAKEDRPVTHSYRLIPKEEGSKAVSNKELNNEVALKKVATPQPKGLTGYEKARAKLEDEMCEIDRLIGLLRNAVERGGKVRSGKTRIENIGEMFYTSLKHVYRMHTVKRVKDNVKDNPQEVLPRIVHLLDEKLSELMVDRERKEIELKQFLEKASAKQRQGK